MQTNTDLNSLFCYQQLITRMQQVREPLHLFQHEPSKQIASLLHAEYETLRPTLSANQFTHIGVLPPLYPEWLGNQAFLAAHHARFPYIVGEMANGIATAQMVIAAAKAGMVGFFGAAGLVPEIIEANIQEIIHQLGDTQQNWGVNLIHSPHEPRIEAAAVDLFFKYQVRRVSASAYLALNPMVVHYACKGLHVDSAGNIQRFNHVIAKISRSEVAKQFMSPAPTDMLAHLLQTGKITEQEAHLATMVPVASDITAEADSGGHTDNRPLTALLPMIKTLGHTLTQQYAYTTPLRVGAAGGLGTPAAVASAFSLGADYVLTGSINQAACESGLSIAGKESLAKADMTDVAMAPAADMFELGVKLQVLKRSTLFVGRANKLYDLYSRYDSLDAIPEIDKAKIEKDLFKSSLANIWESTKAFFTERDPEQIQRAQHNPKHKMALVFRWYLGLSSHWAIQGDANRVMDYQIWCGPAMGAFNQWVAGTFLEPIANRTVEQIGRNLLEGATKILRAQQLRSFGVPLGADAFTHVPQPLG